MSWILSPKSIIQSHNSKITNETSSLTPADLHKSCPYKGILNQLYGVKRPITRK